MTFLTEARADIGDDEHANLPPVLPQEVGVGEPDLQDYLQVLRRRKVIIGLSIVIVLGASLLLSFVQTPRYASVGKLLLRPRTAGAMFLPNAPMNAPSSERSVQTEIEVVESEPVRALVRERIGSAPPVHVRPVGQTDVVTIRAESTIPARAAEVSNAYASAYMEFRLKQAVAELAAASEEVQNKITDLNRQLDGLGSQLASAPACVDTRTTADACNQRKIIEDTTNSRRATLLNQLGVFQQRLDQLQVDSALSTGGAQVVTPAFVPTKPFAPTPVRNGILGAVLGILTGIGLAFVREHLDHSIKGKEDFERAVPGLGVIGMIPQVADWRAKDQSRVVSLSDPTSQAAEAYRILRTSIQFLGIDRKVRIIQVTSAGAQEGKTTTLSNLAVAFARSGMRTVAVCCDLRRPRLHTFFDLESKVGFTSVLLGEVSLANALQPVPHQDRLLVLPAGPQPPNPAELLSSNSAAELLRCLADQADVVLIDSPPILPVTDSIVLSQRVDATVLVVSAGVTTRKAGARAAEMLRQVNAPLVGAVINGVAEESGYGGYSSRYYTALAASDGAASPTNGSGNGNGNGARSRRRARRKARKA